MKNFVSDYVADKLKEFRTIRKITQQELAEYLNTTQQTIARYENNERKLTHDVLYKLANFFKVSINDFFPPIDTSTSEMILDEMGSQLISIAKLSLMTGISTDILEDTLSPKNKLPKPSVLVSIASALNEDIENYFIAAGYIEDPEDIDNHLYKTGIRYLLSQEERMVLCDTLAKIWSNENKNDKVVYNSKKVYYVIFGEDEKKEFTIDEVKTIIEGEQKRQLTFAEKLSTQVLNFETFEESKEITENTLKKDINNFDKITSENKKALINMLDFFIKQSKQ